MSNSRREFLLQAGLGTAMASASAIATATPTQKAGTAPQPVEYTGSSGHCNFAAGDVVTYESRDRIALIRINRLAQRNVINAETTNRLHDAWLRFNASNDLVAVLTGTGNEAFCSGGDHWKRAEDVWWCFPGAGVAVEPD